MKKQKQKLLLLATAALLASGSVAHSQTREYQYTQTGAQKITALKGTIDIINNRLLAGGQLRNGAVGYATVGRVVVDGALDGGKITDAQFVAYKAALDKVVAHDYATATNAKQLFTQEHTAAMNQLKLAVDLLTSATSILATATAVSSVAAEADTKPEQVALQDMLQTDEYSIQASEVSTYNDAVGNVEKYAQQAGAFMAAANNTDLTASIDTYTATNSLVAGNYTSITYTQDVDEFVITWSGNGTGWSGYLTDDMKNASAIYGANTYIQQNGTPIKDM
tara:strand:- start:1627 stop:2463 length:837 start_codon:yes stop_codon:yes gene_type:complete